METIGTDAQVQAHCRHANESIEEVSRGFGVEENRLEVFLCECGDVQCARTVEMTIAEYEQVRDDATSFTLAVNHEDPQVEHLVTENDRFAVVTTIGEASRAARHTDPRSLRASQASPSTT